MCLYHGDKLIINFCRTSNHNDDDHSQTILVKQAKMITLSLESSSDLLNSWVTLHVPHLHLSIQLLSPCVPIEAIRDTCSNTSPIHVARRSSDYNWPENTLHVKIGHSIVLNVINTVDGIQLGAMMTGHTSRLQLALKHNNQTFYSPKVHLVTTIVPATVPRNSIEQGATRAMVMLSTYRQPIVRKEVHAIPFDSAMPRLERMTRITPEFISYQKQLLIQMRNSLQHEYHRVTVPYTACLQQLYSGLNKECKLLDLGIAMMDILASSSAREAMAAYKTIAQKLSVNAWKREDKSISSYIAALKNAVGRQFQLVQ